MSRLADPSAEREVALPGACQCPGSPHDADRVWVRGDFSSRDVAALQRATALAVERPDDNATLVPALFPHVRRWNLLDDRGAALELTPDALESLRPADLEAVISGIAEAVRRADQVPNPSGAPSAESPLGSASPTP